MNECPECGTILTAAHASCPSCGHEVREQTRECDRCGETISADAEACPACGHLMVPATCERHPERKAEGQCALCGRTLCEECDRGGRRYHLCEEHAGVNVIEGWAEILSLADEVEAKLIDENLQAEGIESRVLSQKDHSAFPVDFGDLARIRLVVPTYAFQEANRVIAAHMDSAGEVSFGCPNCGGGYAEGDKVCGSCGEALV